MFNFMRYRLVYLFISGLVLVPGIYTLVRYGLKSAIDFTGGALLEVQINNRQPNTPMQIESLITFSEVELVSLDANGNNYILKLKPIDSAKKNEIISRMKNEFGDVLELRFSAVGPILGKELLQKTSIAAIFAILAILLYIAWAFKDIRFGISAITALIHDIMVVIGVFAILGRFIGVEVDALFVTAVLTTMSFSVHDTIVVFDRIREAHKKYTKNDSESLINQALTETMGRSLNNSLTIIFMLLALFLLGGETIKWFILALLIGTVSGTYSSPFVAVPILYTWNKIRPK